MRAGLLLCAILLTHGLPALAAASLSDARGAVQYRSGDGRDWGKARIAQALPDGSQLRTGPGSSAVMSFEDGSRVELGAATTFTLDASKRSGRLSLGFLMAWIHKATGGFSIRTPTAVIAVRGTRYSVAVGADGKTLVKVFEGSVSVKDKKGVETLLQDNQETEADARGVGAARAIATAALPGTDWTMAPPEGYTATLEGGYHVWNRQSQETVTYGGRQWVVTHHEKIQIHALSNRAWREGQPFLPDCGGIHGEELKEGVSRESAQGKPAFSWSCFEPGGRRGGPGAYWISMGQSDHHYVVAYDFDGQSSSLAFDVAYFHNVDAGARPPDDLENFIGTSGHGGDRDGPGYAAYQESLQTLAPPAAAPPPQNSETNGAVPLLR